MELTSNEKRIKEMAGDASRGKPVDGDPLDPIDHENKSRFIEQLIHRSQTSEES